LYIANIEETIISSQSQFVHALIENSDTLGKRLSALHDRLLETVPVVSRIACALYDNHEDLLKTFINSTREGSAIVNYEYKLSNSRSLSQLAASGNFRVLDDISQAIQSDNAHSVWLRQQGYQSSFTVPIYDQAGLMGFVFFDSMEKMAFTPEIQRDLVLYSNLISMAISSEVSVVHSMVDSTRMAREIAEVRDFETGAHLERMAEYSRMIAKVIAPQFGLDDEFVESIYLFAPLHDIGKIGIPDKILLKEAKLDAEERLIMNLHVEKGIEIIERIIGRGGMSRLPDSVMLRNIVLCHHERMDGSGYPKGLRGEEIPLEARIVAVADVFDALTSTRPYKRTWSREEAFAELSRMAQRGELDADCIQALMQSAETIEDIRRRNSDAAESGGML
jgi:HD-GYP domain-containing protein (c-di-GMP phosphodiesterase class II)